MPGRKAARRRRTCPSLSLSLSPPPHPLPPPPFYHIYTRAGTVEPAAEQPAVAERVRPGQPDAGDAARREGEREDGAHRRTPRARDPAAGGGDARACRRGARSAAAFDRPRPRLRRVARRTPGYGYTVETGVRVP
jgi:hypothetical protein